MLKVFVFLRDPVDLSGGNSKQGRNLLQTFKSWSETQEPADSVSSETHFFPPLLPSSKSTSNCADTQGL